MTTYLDRLEARNDELEARRHPKEPALETTAKKPTSDAYNTAYELVRRYYPTGDGANVLIGQIALTLDKFAERRAKEAVDDALASLKRGAK